MPEARVYQCPVCGAFAREGERSCRHCTTALATLRCGHCFDLSFPDDLHCRGCGLELGLEPAPEPSELGCPDCKLTLKSFAAGAGTLHACEACGGQLVSHGLLRALLESREILGSAVPSVVDAPRSNPLASPVVYRPCPACQQIMNRRNFGSTSGIIIDFCSLHGSFFDAGELPRVLEFVRRGGLARARAQARAEARPTASAGSLPALTPAGTAGGPDGFDVVDLFTFVVDMLTPN
jgi:Zn-finger nucleic acid-binding protein